jgi:hypothetical protein
MPEDIAKALAYQVKRDIAEQYFGSRKAIEEDIEAFKDALAQADKFYNEKIGPDLIRIYDILSDSELVRQFMKMAGFGDETPFYKEYASGRMRVEEWPSSHGWTAFSRLLNRLIDSYRWLYRDTMKYRAMLDDLKDEALVIKEEVKGFHGRFALDEIMGFINTLDRDELSHVLGENLRGGELEALNANLQISGPPEPEEALNMMPDLPQPDRIKGLLKALARDAYKKHKG